MVISLRKINNNNNNTILIVMINGMTKLKARKHNRINIQALFERAVVVLHS